VSRLLEGTPLPDVIRNYNGLIDGTNLMPGGVDHKSFALWANQQSLFFFSLNLPGTAFVGTNQAGMIFPSGVELLEIRLFTDQAPTGADLIVNVKQNGTAIVTATARPRVLAGTTQTAVVREFTTAPLFVAGDRLQIDVDQVGSTIAGGSDILVCGFGRERAV